MLVLIAGAVQFPYLQTRIVSAISKHYSSLTGFDITIQRIAIDWFDEVSISDLRVVDPGKNELLTAAHVQIDFSLESLLNKNNHNVDNIVIDKANLLLTKIIINDSTTLNINELIRRIKALSKAGSGGRQVLSADHLSITNTTFAYNDQERDSIKDGFDYHHFILDDINGEFEALHAVADTFQLDVKSLTAIDRATDLDIKQLETHFSVSQSAMSFNDLDLKAGNSIIRDEVIFNYNSTLDLSDFNNRVVINADLNKTLLHSRDLALFAPALKDFNEFYELSGHFAGKVNNFTFDQANLRFGKGTVLKGTIRMSGLPAYQETFINFDLVNSNVLVEDLKYYLKEKTYTRLKPFDNISFDAEFLGYPNDFVARGDFQTMFGSIKSDINLKLEEDINNSSYSGKLIMHEFDLGGYMQNRKVGNVTLSGEIKGTGFTLEDANFKLKGKIDEININKYPYRNIETDAQFAKEFFEGYVKIQDPNLRLTTIGSIDLRKGINLFNIKVDLDTASLKPLNLSRDDIYLKSKIDINARGLKIDSLVGIASLSNTIIYYNGSQLELDTLSLVSRKKAGERQMSLKTNLLDIIAGGDFDYSVVYRDLKQLLYEYKLNLENDRVALREYYREKNREYNDYTLSYSVHLKDLNPVLKLMAPELRISKNSFIGGDFTGGYTSIISLETSIDSIFYKNAAFFENELQLNISKIADSTNVLAMAYAASEKQNIAGIDTKDLVFEGIWNKLHIDFGFDIDQVKYNNYARLVGSIDFLPDRTLVHFEPSDLNILDKKWRIEKSNAITLRGSEITFDKFRIFNGTQGISVNGEISKKPEKILEVRADSLKLENFNTIISKDLSGIINGYAEIKNYYKDLQVQNEIMVTDLHVDQFLIGDVAGANFWNNLQQHFELNFFIRRQGNMIVVVNGTYAPKNEREQLNMKAYLNRTELRIIEPFINNYFSRINGTASGEINITGTLDHPVVTGQGTIDKGYLHVNYLGTGYELNGDFYFEPDRIGFKEMRISDSRRNPGILTGYVSHRDYKDFYMNIGGNVSNIQVLNTTSNDNDLFYGTGIVSGSVNFIGPIDNMNIIAQATTEKGTRIFIPIGDSESIEKEEYINFINFRDTTDAVNINNVSKVDLKGLKLDFDLNITPDAYCEIIFDIKAGDIIRGRGNGDINLQIDTKGDFNMFGDYHIQEGGYNFTLYNIINKEFELLPDSRISWYGDPYQGILDINATYSQLASFLPLLINQESDKVYEEAVELKRKYPVKVLLEIDGPLLTPAVNFDIVTTDLPRNIKVPDRPDVDLEFEFLKFKNSIDEQELKRQVFSLIVLRRFSPLQSFNTGGSITSSVSELLSNQLSYWITQVDENLEIDLDVDLDQLDEEAYNTFQLRLSYTFLEGRLRVTRDGGFVNQQKTDISSLAGDWTLEYLLTPDGKFRAKMYNRTNYNPINPTEENHNTVTTGFSIIHTQSFDELKELFKRSKKQDDESENEDQSIPGSVNREGIKEDYEVN